MDNLKDLILLAGSIFGLLSLPVSVWVTLKRTRPQVLVDDSSAAVNFQALVIALQARMKESDAANAEKIAELEGIIKGAVLKIEIKTTLGGTPNMIYTWDIPTKIQQKIPA